MKPDEEKFLCLLANDRPKQLSNGPNADDIGIIFGMPLKRMHFLYEKWGRQGIWESGVSDRTGWLTDKGLEIAADINNANA